MSTDIKLSKAQINKMIKEGGNFGRLLMSFLPKFIKPAISIGKNILATLESSAAMSATDAAIQKQMYGSGMTALIISNDDLEDLIKIITALEEHDILLKGTTKTIQNETKKQEGGFLSMLLGTLGASLLGNLLTVKGMHRNGNGIYRTGQRLNKINSISSSTSFEIMDYFKDVEGFKRVFSRNSLPKLKNGAYVINLDHSENTGTHWVVIFMKKDEVIYFDSFRIEYIPKEIMKKIGNKDIKTNIFRIQDNNSIMCGYFCILFIEYMLNNKTLTNFTNLFIPWDFKKNNEIIKNYFN